MYVCKIRKTENINNEIINYQSKPELKFINYLNSKNVLIKNGPKIDYNFKNSNRTYEIDFYLPDYDLLIEIKGDHIWHKNDIKTGKWQMKEKIATEYAKNNKLKYKLIFTQYLDEFLNTF